MKRLILLYLVLSSFIGLAQETKSQLVTRFNVIRTAGTGQNTAARIANAYQELSDGSIGVYPVAATGTDTYTGSLIGIDAYSGRILFVTFANNNTGASTLTINSIGPTSIKKDVSGTWTALSADDIVAGKLYRLYNDGTEWQIDVAGSGGGGSQSLQDVINVSDVLTSPVAITSADLVSISTNDGAGNTTDLVINPNGESYLLTTSPTNASGHDTYHDLALITSADLTNTYGDAIVKVTTNGTNTGEITSTNFGATEQAKVLVTPLNASLIAGTAGTSFVSLTKTDLEIAPGGDNGSNGQVLQSDGTHATWQTIATGSGTVASGTIGQIAAYTGTTTVGSLTTTTYPSLTELSYGKGVTSAIQTQLNAKAPSTSGTSVLKGNGSGGFSTATNADLPAMTATVGGAVPTPPNNTTTFLRGDGTFATPSGGGDVSGPASSVDSEIAIFNSTTGKIIKRASGSGWGKLTSGVLSTITPGTGVETWVVTPSWTNFNSAITGTAPFWSLASGGTTTGTNTLTLSTNPLIFSSGVTTGTGATAGLQLAANSLTTGNGWDVSSSSVTTGSLGKYTSTSTTVNHTAGSGGLLTVSSSGANGTSSKTTIGASSVVTNTGTTSTNVGAYFDASGATTNYAIQTGVNPILINNARMFSVNTTNLFWGVSAGSLALSGGSGVENIGIGTNAGAALSTGNRNTYLGYNAGATQIGGFNNTFLGNAAGRLTTGSANTFVGKSAGEVTAAGASNTAVGNAALSLNTSGGSNLAIGSNSLAAASTISNNMAIGNNSFSLLTSGTQNVGVGMNSGFTQTTASNQVFVGYNAGFNVTGNQNIAIGTEAMSGTGTFGSGPNTGANNVFIGYTAGDFMQSGDQNTVLGSLAMAGANTGGNNTSLGYNTLNVTTGSFNIAIGSGTSATLSSGSNNTLIGKQLTPQSLTGSDQLSIMNAIFGTGNSATGTTVSTGNIGILTTAPNSNFHVLGSVAANYVAKTTTYNIAATDYSVEVTSGTFTATLPTAVGIPGRFYFITNSGSGVVTLATTSSQTFVNITATPTTVTLNQFNGILVQSNGAAWIKISSF